MLHGAAGRKGSPKDVLLSALLRASVSLLVRPETGEHRTPSELLGAERVGKHGEVFGEPDFLRGKRLPRAGGEGWLPTGLAPHDAARAPRRQGARGKRRAGGSQAGTSLWGGGVVQGHRAWRHCLKKRKLSKDLGWDRSCARRWL